MCLTMFNHVQPCSTNVQPICACWDCLWPNMAILGQKGWFWALLGPPGDISGWSKRLKLTPPDVKYNVQPCSTNVQPIWACWDCLWPNMAISGQKGRFRALLGPPGDISGWSKRLKLTPPDVKYNVQPCSTNVQPIWACWDCLWPNMAISGQKRAIFGHKNGLNH